MKFSNKFKIFLVFFIIATISVLTPLNQFSSAISVDNNVQAAVDTHKILLDSNAEILYEIEQSGKTYYVVMYTNSLPFASGLEVILKDGTLISSSNQVKIIFTSIAWIEASKKLTSSDIETLNNILLASNKINNAVSPIYSTTASVLDKVDWLKTQCIGVSIAKVCAWDVVISSYPQIPQLERAIRLLNNELKEWDNASTDVNRNLSKTITGLEKLRTGGELNQMLENDIEKSLSSFVTLKSKTNEMVNSLSGIITILSAAESSLKSLSSTPLVGNMILSLADFIAGLNSQVISLSNDAQSFSNTLTTQSKKLASVTDFAEKRTNELFASWDARQNAVTTVYTTVIGIVVVIAIMSGIVVIFSKKRRSVGRKISIPDRKFCRKCGFALSKSAKFCGKCGNLS